MYDEIFINSKFFVKKAENINATMMQIHEKIRQARDAAHLTEEEMAEKIGVKRSTYQYWEKKDTSIENLRKVAKALGKPDDYFLGNPDEIIINGKNEQDVILKLLGDIIRGNLELIENNKTLARITEKHTMMLGSKMTPASIDLAEIASSLKRIDATLSSLVKVGSIQGAEEAHEIDEEQRNDKNKELAGAVRKSRGSGKQKPDNSDRN